MNHDEIDSRITRLMSAIKHNNDLASVAILDICNELLFASTTLKKSEEKFEKHVETETKKLVEREAEINSSNNVVKGFQIIRSQLSKTYYDQKTYPLMVKVLDENGFALTENYQIASDTMKFTIKFDGSFM